MSIEKKCNSSTAIKDFVGKQIMFPSLRAIGNSFGLAETFKSISKVSRERVGEPIPSILTKFR